MLLKRYKKFKKKSVKISENNSQI